MEDFELYIPDELSIRSLMPPSCPVARSASYLALRHLLSLPDVDSRLVSILMMSDMFVGFGHGPIREDARQRIRVVYLCVMLHQYLRRLAPPTDRCIYYRS